MFGFAKWLSISAWIVGPDGALEPETTLLEVQWQVQVQGQDTSEVQVSERCAETTRDFKTSGASLVKGRHMMRACKAMMRVPKQ